VCPNINRTLVKKINCTFLLFTQNKLESYLIDYDDSNTESFHAYGTKLLMIILRNFILIYFNMFNLIIFCRKFG